VSRLQKISAAKTAPDAAFRRPRRLGTLDVEILSE
jgi:hypothetical protein